MTTIESENSAASEPAAAQPKGGRKPTKKAKAQKKPGRTKRTAGAKTDRNRPTPPASFVEPIKKEPGPPIDLIRRGLGPPAYRGRTAED